MQMTAYEICACAGLIAMAKAAVIPILRSMRLLLGWNSDSEVSVDLAHARLQGRVGNHVHDAAVLDHVIAVGHRLREAEVLLDQQDGKAFLLEARDGAADLLHDHRRESLGRLIEHQEARPRAQDATDGEHLLLAAGELGALAREALAQIRKQLVDLLEREAAVAHLWRQQQIFLHAEAREDAALLRAESDAKARDGV